jgi:peroxiredoxin
MNRKRSRILATAFLSAALALATAVSAAAQEMPKVGDTAPDFTLKHFDGTDRRDVKLSDFRGKKNVIVAFYVFAFTGG